jgi:hypothetical protein
MPRPSTSRPASRLAATTAALIVSALLAACGGGGDGTTTTAGTGGSGSSSSSSSSSGSSSSGSSTGVTGTLGGTAATGAPVVGGRVDVACAGGADLTTTTSSNGTWQVSLSSHTLPCKVRVSGGNLPASLALHSVAVDLGNVNITPVTDLVVANLGGQSPATWWTAATPAELGKISAAQVSAAVERIRSGLNLSTLTGVNPVTATFTATPSDPLDKALEAIKAVFTDYGVLLAQAQGTNFAGFVQNYASALNQALAGSGTGGGSTGTGGGSTGGTGAATGSLTIQVTAAGMSLPPTTLSNVPRPGSQQSFCSEISSSGSSTSLSTAIPSALGSFTVNSCSFSGNVGTVNATLSITSPFPISTAYSVVYTYN